MSDGTGYSDEWDACEWCREARAACTHSGLRLCDACMAMKVEQELELHEAAPAAKEVA